MIDTSDAEGACFAVQDGREFTLRSFTMIGHSGFTSRDQCGALRTRGVRSMWGMYLKGCNAVSIRNTERVLLENCHARRMATEAFFAQGRSRHGTRPEPRQYQRQLTYLRCSAIDCGRNGFNNNDLAENTSILHCRIVDVGGCAWEGASRFVRFMHNYVRNAGTVAMGNIGSRVEELEELGSGQHIVANNVFEGHVPDRRYDQLVRVVGRCIDRETDTVRIYRLCARCREATEVIGTGVYVEDDEDDIFA